MAKRRFLRSAAVGALSVLAVSTAVWAAGLFPGFPIVGSAAYCSSVSGIGNTAGTGQPSITGTPGQFGQGNPQTNTTGNFASVCNVQVSAGPVNVPPSTVFPADTGLAQGQQPQTVLVPLTLTGGVVVDLAPLTGTSFTVPQGVNKVLLDPAGTIAALTVVLPIAAQLLDGQEFSLSSSQTVTALTITAGAGTSIVATATTTLGPTTAAVTYIYHAATTKWTNG